MSRRLKNQYGIDYFRDEDSHKFVAEWRPCWRQQLDLRDPRTPDAGPSVIVLATDAAAESRPSGEDVVGEEIWEALPLTPGDRRNHVTCTSQAPSTRACSCSPNSPIVNGTISAGRSS